jgi:glutamate/tyrosine decarboxylase-like PLP-dependent enzyme
MSERIDPKTRRNAPIAIDAEGFRRMGHRLVDDVAELLATMPDRRVAPGETPAQVQELLGANRALPEDGTDPEALLKETTDLLFDHSLFNGHPRFFGYITSSPAPIGILGDFLASAINPNTGGWMLSPLATEIERQSVAWIADLLGYPTDCGGLLVSGGNMANMVGLWAARAQKASTDIRVVGAREGAQMRVYVSEETHTWIQKGSDLSGLGTDAVRWIATDAELRMDVDVLRRRIHDDRAAGDQPFMVVGTGGSVSTGLVDPLPEIAALCREEDLWFHVDGAYGGFAVASPDAPDELRALSEADSVAVDPHKWLYAPLEAGCALVRNPDHLRDAFSYRAPYYHFGLEAISFVDYGPQNSRGFRALKVWLALKQVGRSGYADMISEDMRLARALYDAVAEHPDLEPMSHGLSITAFRFIPADLRAAAGDEAVATYLNDLNREIQARMELGGEAFVSNAVIKGRYALRACIVNFNTGIDDIGALPEIVVRTGRNADAELRAGGLHLS